MKKSALYHLPLLLIIIASLLMDGCASTSKATAERSDAAKTFTIPMEKGSVYLYRVGRVYASAVQLSVKINGLDAGGTGPNTFFKWDLLPGTYTFLSTTDESSAVVELEVEPGKNYFIRQDIRMGVITNRVKMKLVDHVQGREEVLNSKLLVSSYIPES